MKHDIIKLDSIIKRVIRESARKYSKPIVEQGKGGLEFIDPNVNPVVDPINTSDDSNKDTNKIKKDKKDKQGRLPGEKWYGFDPGTKKFILGPHTGKTAKEVFGTKDASPKPNPQVTPTDDPKYVPKARAKRMYDCKGFISDSEELYKNLIVGSKPQRVAGGGLAGGIPAIANKTEWKKVETELLKLTSNRGIVVYGETFIKESSVEIWRPIFEWIGKNLGGDKLTQELKLIEFDKNKTYAAIAKKYKNVFPDTEWENLTPEEQAERLRQRQQTRQSKNFLTPNMSLTLWAILTLGGGALLWKLGRGILNRNVGGEFPKLAKLLQRLQRPITEEEIVQLKEYVEDLHNDGKITDAELVVWNKFFRQRAGWFNNERRELNYNIGRWRKGPVAPKSFKPPFYDEYGRRIYKWDGLSVDEFIKTLPNHLKQDAAFKQVLQDYEKTVLEPWRSTKYGTTTKTKNKTATKTTTTVTPSSDKLTKFKINPTATETQSKLFTTIKIQNPEIISSKELKQIFTELRYKDVENIMKNKGESAQAWSTIKNEYKAGNVALINTHINRGRVPSYPIWLQDMKQAFPKKDASTFDKVAYNRYKVYMKIYNLMKA